MRGCGMGFGRRGGAWGWPRGFGGLIMASLTSGPKNESEIKEYVAKAAGVQINYSLEPYLDMLVAYGVLTKANGRYSLKALTLPPLGPGPWWAF